MGSIEQYNQHEKVAEKSELEMKVSKLSQQYIGLQGGDLRPDDLESIFKATDALKETEDSSVIFLRSMLNLESFYLEQKDGNQKKPIQDYDTSGEIFKKVFDNLSFITEKGEKFFVKIKNYDGNEVEFGNLSIVNAYLGDMHMIRYYVGDSKNQGDWDKADELYRKAIELEKTPGIKHEIKTILSIRRLANYLGKENSIYAIKTTRRMDLRRETADMILEYFNESKGNFESFLVDVTARDKKEKTSTSVVKIPYELIDYIADLDFNHPPLVKVDDAGSFRDDKTKKIMRNFSRLASEFSEAFDMRNREKGKFKADLFLEESKISKYFPAMRKESIRQMREALELGLV